MRINLDYLHDCSNLRRLLAENPKLPVIVYCPKCGIKVLKPRDMKGGDSE